MSLLHIHQSANSYHLSFRDLFYNMYLWKASSYTNKYRGVARTKAQHNKIQCTFLAVHLSSSEGLSQEQGIAGSEVEHKGSVER